MGIDGSEIKRRKDKMATKVKVVKSIDTSHGDIINTTDGEDFRKKREEDFPVFVFISSTVTLGLFVVLFNIGVSLIIDLIITLFIGGSLIALANLAKNQKEAELFTSTMKDFLPTQKIIGSDAKTGIALDESREKICLFYRHNGSLASRIASYNEIISSEIVEDGTTITKSGASVGRALVGGVLLGGVGAVVGGLSGKKESSEKINKIELQIIMNDTTRPIHRVNFLSRPSEKDESFYKNAMEKALHWHGLIRVLIERGKTTGNIPINNQDVAV